MQVVAWLGIILNYINRHFRWTCLNHVQRREVRPGNPVVIAYAGPDEGTQEGPVHAHSSAGCQQYRI